jgi:hypothetical protein
VRNPDQPVWPADAARVLPDTTSGCRSHGSDDREVDVPRLFAAGFGAARIGHQAAQSNTPVAHP